MFCQHSSLVLLAVTVLLLVVMIFLVFPITLCYKYLLVLAEARGRGLIDFGREKSQVTVTCSFFFLCLFGRIDSDCGSVEPLPQRELFFFFSWACFILHLRSMCQISLPPGVDSVVLVWMIRNKEQMRHVLVIWFSLFIEQHKERVE